MDSRLHGNDGKKPPRKEGDQKVKGEGTFLSPALSPPERMEIRKKERERRERYPNAAAANATATTGGQECPPSVGCPPLIRGDKGGVTGIIATGFLAGPLIRGVRGESGAK